MNESPIRQEPAEEVLEGLRQVRRLLRQPSGQALAACLPRLEAAVGRLKQIEASLRDDDVPAGQKPRIRRELTDFERELRVIQSLMNHAARYHSMLGQLLATGREAAHYDAQGFLAAAAARPRLHVLRG